MSQKGPLLLLELNRKISDGLRREGSRKKGKVMGSSSRELKIFQEQPIGIRQKICGTGCRALGPNITDFLMEAVSIEENFGADVFVVQPTCNPQ